VEISLDKRAVKQIRLSAAEAIEDGDTETLKEDVFEAFPEDRVEMLEQLLGGTDFMGFLAAVLDDWSGDDVDELFELLETQLGEHGADLKYPLSDAEPYDEEDSEDEYSADQDESDEAGVDDEP
jgi:hypothetical protein